MFQKNILWLLRKISWRLGYIVFNKDEVALTAYGEDPRELPYLCDLPYAVQNLPVKKGVGLRFYSFEGPTYHPFLLALQLIKDNYGRRNLAFEVLKKYNELCSLRTANEFLGLDDSEGSFLKKSHPYAYTYPWSTMGPHETKKQTLAGVKGENKRYGFDAYEALDLPNVSDKKIWIETERLSSLLTKIQEEGFRPRSQDSLGCFVLYNGSDWRWHVHGGQHRAAVLSVLGYDRLPVCVRRIIRREDVDFWPQVQSGFFTRTQALLVFDRLFRAEPPPLAKKWVDYVNQTFHYKVEKNV